MINLFQSCICAFLLEVKYLYSTLYIFFNNSKVPNVVSVNQDKNEDYVPPVECSDTG